ncbi:MAG: bifunctional riboflavin kinase/FAD synthetase [Calditrichaeota bacterium]|nr:MAG: bifunctional riboflavin kinase/FAD synthetase [Calditrichota bacterium]
MEIIYGFNKKLGLDRVVTMGTFDGVHRGHLKILESLHEEARRLNAVSTVLTFEPHPRVVLNRLGKAPAVKLLNDFEEKVALLEAHRVEDVIVIRFDEAFSQLSYETFFENYILSRMNLKCLIVGHDHAFGKDRKGTIDAVRALAHAHDFCVRPVEAYHVDDAPVSSSRIRRLLEEGRVDSAAGLLGYPYRLSGTVVPGDARGRLLNFPTANIAPRSADKLIPATGVYAVDVVWRERRYKGMMNIGYRPTFDKNAFALEVHIHDFAETIYEETLTVHFKKRLRDEKKFASKEALIAQLMKDKNDSLNI